MSDPQRLPDDHPRRAEPLQPDRPGSGRKADPRPADASDEEALDKAVEQERTAIDNVRDA
jgi:hypothetical protein